MEIVLSRRDLRVITDHLNLRKYVVVPSADPGIVSKMYRALSGPDGVSIIGPAATPAEIEDLLFILIAETSECEPVLSVLHDWSKHEL